ncbi:MAG: type II toxin-antitoxin system death-on-curing family toxin [Pseudomonadota bacterium]|nr:type II toxin-antitoxin system death-on-curing family toxin [Pseudomonadota bacterium]
MTFGGRNGVLSLDAIEAAISRPYTGYYRPIARKAAALLESVTSNHGFTDGNKRTAWILVELLLERSGYTLDIPDDEPIDDFVVAVVTHEVDFEQSVQWFQTRLSRQT